jgi:hypothetical protein
MRKSLYAIILCLAVMAAAAPAFPQAAREATIEPETKAKIILQSTLSSKLSEPGDPIRAVLDEPVYVNSQLVLPRGTEFIGRVTEVKAAGRGMKNARMGIIFDRIAMPWGEEPIAINFSSIDDWDKNEKIKANDEGEVKGGKKGKDTAENVMIGGSIGGAGAGVLILSGGSRAAGAGMLGAGMLAGLFLTKGGELHVKPGAVFRIKFVKPLTLPVVQQPSASPKPIQQEGPVVEKAEPTKKP